MSHFVNPLLLDRSAATTGLRAAEIIGSTARNFARGTSDSASFAAELAATQATAPAAGAPVSLAKPSVSPGAISATEEDALNEMQISRSERLGNSSVEADNDVDDFSIWDIVDIINPLQHIPILGAMYREATGDEIKPVTRIAGDILFGALMGGPVMSAVTAIAGAAAEQQIGEDPDKMIADALFGPIGVPPAGDQPAPVMVASAPETPAAEIALASSPTSTAASASSAMTANPVIPPPAVKQPYGGVMDLATAAQGRAAPMAPVGQQVAAPRIGNVIYASPIFNHAARVASAPKATTAAPVAPLSMSEAKTVSSLVGAPAGLPIPGASDTNKSPTLGQIAAPPLRASGNSGQLPPELVQDMMMMALDKYKAAGGLAPSEMKAMGPQ